MKLLSLALTAAVTAAPLAAQDTAQDTAGRSSLSATFGWSSLNGTIGGGGIELADIGGTGIDVSGAFRTGEQGYDTQLSLEYGKRIGSFGKLTDPEAFFAVSHKASDWDSDAYAGRSSELTGGIAGGLGAFDVTLAAFARMNAVTAWHAEASPLITAEDAESYTAGGLFAIGTSDYTGAGLARTGKGASATLRVAPLGSRNFASFEVEGRSIAALPDNFTLHISGGAGVITGLNGQDVSIYDRAFLGGNAPRGFGVGGIGPRDVAGAVDAPLGGTRYVLGSVELRHPVSDRVSIGAFADAGSVWKLDGAPVGASGAIDDSMFVNTAVGGALYWETGIGTFNLSLAQPLRTRPDDQQSSITFSLSKGF